MSVLSGDAWKTLITPYTESPSNFAHGISAQVAGVMSDRVVPGDMNGEGRPRSDCHIQCYSDFVSRLVRGDRRKSARCLLNNSDGKSSEISLSVARDLHPETTDA